MAFADLQCQLINIITQKKDIYRLIYSVLYLCIIIIICTLVYWDTIYKDAKKYSKCNNISKIIDENYYNETSDSDSSISSDSDSDSLILKSTKK